MGFTPEQIKGRIKSVAKQNNADARTLMRIYMMERFLERLAQSEYRDNFIIKGGIPSYGNDWCCAPFHDGHRHQHEESKSVCGGCLASCQSGQRY